LPESAVPESFLSFAFSFCDVASSAVIVGPPFLKVDPISKITPFSIAGPCNKKNSGIISPNAFAIFKLTTR
jgi:hypothetical protein